jgi:gamma-glutamyltranspeptidase/glutathione hydrolase
MISLNHLFTLALSILAFSPDVQPQSLPQAVTYNNEMVVTTNSIATEVGVKILKQGGNAVDAMIAIQAVLGLVEPQSSGIGGGAFVVYYDAKSRKTSAIDAREKAPASSTEGHFYFSWFPFAIAWQSGLSVGVPGIPRMMEHLHHQYGQLPWHTLFHPAIKLARDGYPLTMATSEEVAALLDYNPLCGIRFFFRDPVVFDYFVNAACDAKPAGTLMHNPAYAETLSTLADKGADGFYTGSIAADIVNAVQNDSRIAGDMTTDDLANYQVVEREPVCFDYHGHKVCGMGPPSSGALAIGQILGILESFDLTTLSPLDIESVHLITQAERLAFADRGLYVGDPDFVTVPKDGMLNKDYLASRAALIRDWDMGVANPGVPPGVIYPAAPDASLDESGTSHISIVDRYGNALAMTTSIEGPFGNGVMVDGFLLNNQLTDFSFAATDSNGLPIANRVQGNKRPRSSMSPTIVFDKDGKVEILTGSPGGSRIIGYTVQSLINIIDFGLDPQQAINIPHYLNCNERTEIEQPIPGVTIDYDAEALATVLKEHGHSDPSLPPTQREVDIIALTSGLSIIQVIREPDFHKCNNDACKRERHQRTILIGGADHRREGIVGGW